jgi:hypothetical protein
LGLHKGRAGVQQFLGRVEDVECGALSDTRFFAYTVERGFSRHHLRLSGQDLRLGGFDLAPSLHRLLLNRVALVIKIDAILSQCLFGLTNRRVFGPPLIEWNRYSAERLHLQ